MSPVLVTGGSGYVGTQLIARQAVSGNARAGAREPRCIRTSRSSARRPARRPAHRDHRKPTGMKASGVAYTNAKLAILYYAHELQRRVGDDIGVAVFEPGWMPGTGLGREASPALQAVGRALTHLPGTSTPARSGPALASLVLDAPLGAPARWYLRRNRQRGRRAAPRPQPRTGTAALGGHRRASQRGRQP
jgi:hypothetical protein